MRETIGRRSTFLVYDCPHCGHTEYVDMSAKDDADFRSRYVGDGKWRCQNCHKIVLVKEKEG